MQRREHRVVAAKLPVAGQVEHVGGARLRAQGVERGLRADKGPALWEQSGHEVRLVGGVGQAARLAQHQRLPGPDGVAQQAAQREPGTRRHGQLAALRKKTLTVVERGKRQQTELGVWHHQHLPTMPQRSRQRCPHQRVQPAHAQLRAGGQPGKVIAHRRCAMAQCVDLETRRAQGFENIAPGRHPVMQGHTGTGDDAGEQLVVEHAVFDQRACFAEQALQGLDREVIVAARGTLGCRCRESRSTGTFQQLQLGAAQFVGQRRRRLAFFVQAMHAPVEPIQAVAQALRGRVVVCNGTLREALAQRAGAETIELEQHLGRELGRRSLCMRQERHSQQLLVGSQVIGQKCAAQFVSRQRPALIFKQFDGGVEGCLGCGVVTQRLPRQPLAGQAAHLHRQQLQLAGAIEGGAEKRAGLLDSTRAQQCMRPHHIGAEAPVRQTCC